MWLRFLHGDGTCQLILGLSFVATLRCAITTLQIRSLKSLLQYSLQSDSSLFPILLARRKMHVHKAQCVIPQRQPDGHAALLPCNALSIRSYTVSIQVPNKRRQAILHIDYEIQADRRPHLMAALIIRKHAHQNKIACILPYIALCDHVCL